MRDPPTQTTFNINVMSLVIYIMHFCINFICVTNNCPPGFFHFNEAEISVSSNCVTMGKLCALRVLINLYINIFFLSGEGEEREGLKYMLCTAELQNTAEIEDSDFNYEMRNISLIYTNDIMPLPVSLTKICKFDLQDIEP